jgi:hypothetical protein
MNTQHILFTRDDLHAPESIKDRNGDIALSLCKVCGRGESELVEPCTLTETNPEQ